MKTRTKMTTSILSALFLVSIAFAGATTVKELTKEQQTSIDSSFKDCRSIKKWPKAKTSDDDLCSCVKWHMSDLAKRTSKFKVEVVQKRFSEAATKKTHPLRGFKKLLPDAFTQQFFEWTVVLCEENPAEKYSFPL